MEALNEDGQWIVMMGFIVAIGMFILAIIISQAPLVGQTTAESVMEFPKNEVQDVRGKLVSMTGTSPSYTLQKRFRGDMALLSMSRNNAIVTYSIDGGNWSSTGTYDDILYIYHDINIHYNNGITDYSESLLLPERK